MKREKFYELLESMKNCEKCINLISNKGKNYSLINIYSDNYSDNEFCKNIPSIWTDWLNRLDSKVMIIGQDWGPYVDMKGLYEQTEDRHKIIFINDLYRNKIYQDFFIKMGAKYETNE